MGCGEEGAEYKPGPRIYLPLLALMPGHPTGKMVLMSTTIVEVDFAKIEADLAVLKWMVGFNLALCAAIVAKLFVN